MKKKPKKKVYWGVFNDYTHKLVHVGSIPLVFIGKKRARGEATVYDSVRPVEIKEIKIKR